MQIKSSRLLTINSIALKSWLFYKTHFKQLLPYMFLYILPMGLWTILPIVSERLSVVVYIVLAIVLSVLIGWYYLALIKAIGKIVETNTVPHWKLSLGETLPLIWRSFYTALLYLIIVIGGLILFIIPGIIFSNWYTFSIYEVLFNGKKGWQALKGSKEIVVGRWWEVLFAKSIPALILTIPVTLISLLLVLPLSFLSTSGTVGLLIQAVLSTLIAAVFLPLPIFAPLVLYFNAKANPVETEEAPTVIG